MSGKILKFDLVRVAEKYGEEFDKFVKDYHMMNIFDFCLSAEENHYEKLAEQFVDRKLREVKDVA